jgi:hypothetical protein
MSKLRELLGKATTPPTPESEWDRMLAHAVLDSYLMRNAEAIATLIDEAERLADTVNGEGDVGNVVSRRLRAALAAIGK